MGSRLYDEFMKKLKVPPVQRFNKHEPGKEVAIAIPLKGGTGVSYYRLRLTLRMLVTDRA